MAALGRARFAGLVLIVAGSAGFGASVGYLIHLLWRVRRLDADADDVGLVRFADAADDSRLTRPSVTPRSVTWLGDARRKEM